MTDDPTMADITHKGAKLFLTRRQRIENVILYCLVIFCIVGGIILFTVRETANGAQADLQRWCPIWRDVATLPVASTTGPIGLGLIADARNGYYGAHCDQTATGPLPPPQSKLLLPKLTGRAK